MSASGGASTFSLTIVLLSLDDAMLTSPPGWGITPTGLRSSLTWRRREAWRNTLWPRSERMRTTIVFSPEGAFGLIEQLADTREPVHCRA